MALLMAKHWVFFVKGGSIQFRVGKCWHVRKGRAFCILISLHPGSVCCVAWVFKRRVLSFSSVHPRCMHVRHYYQKLCRQYILSLVLHKLYICKYYIHPKHVNSTLLATRTERYTQTQFFDLFLLVDKKGSSITAKRLFRRTKAFSPMQSSPAAEQRFLT